MESAALFFLTSGLFLGWSLGANDAASVFGTAVGTRMIRFSTAATLCGVFVIVGAVISGGGTTDTLGRLGAVNALPGAFVAALCSGTAVYGMNKLGIPVSTTQAIVGAIIGWNVFSGHATDPGLLARIVSTWLLCPVLAAAFSMSLFTLVRRFLKAAQIHLLRIDAYTRLALVITGVFGAYSLGANNIANVIGVFVPASPFTDFMVPGGLRFTAVQQLLLLGGIAIAAGMITNSRRVVETVGGQLSDLTPVAAWAAVMAHSLVLFLFASRGLEALLLRYGLPTLPLVPVSSSQAIVGAVLGIGLLRSARNVRWRLVGHIMAGWVITPVVSGVLCFIALFFMENVFNQVVYH